MSFTKQVLYSMLFGILFGLILNIFIIPNELVENLLIETDSPYLAPLPYRGKSNEPSYIVHTVKKLSEIKKISKENVISKTTKNFKKLFELS